MPLVVTLTATNVSSYGLYDGTLTVSNVTGGTAPFTYVWSDSSAYTGATRSALPVGTYGVTVTSANAVTGTASVTLTQPAAALTLVSTPVTVTASWGRTAGEQSYRVTYRKQGDPADTIAYPNTRANRVLIANLVPASTYTIKVLASSTGTPPHTTTRFTATTTTGVNSVGNFTRAPFLSLASAYDVRLVGKATTATVNPDAVIASVFTGGERLSVTGQVAGGSTRRVQAALVKVGTTGVIKTRGDAVCIPFDTAGNTTQTASIVGVTGVNKDVVYNKQRVSVTVDTVEYFHGDTFSLDGQRVTVNVV
jgi:hypothetical protein